MTASPAARKVCEGLADVFAAMGPGLARSAAELALLLEKPKDSKKGDLALPCFQFSKAFGKPPPEVARNLCEHLGAELKAAAGVSRVEVAGPYLNFYLDRALLAASVVPAIVQDGSHLARRASTVAATGERKDKVMVEYSQPNTHKAFHVGHLRNAALGDSVRRLLEWGGHEVVPVNYIGDEGAHVAKALWHLRHVFEGEIPADHRGEFLGDQYTRGTEMQSLDSYTAVAKPGVRAALVHRMEKHPEADFKDAKGRLPFEKWQVVTLQMPLEDASKEESAQSLKNYTVVTGAQGFKVGDMVAYAAVGVKLGNKTLTLVDKRGISSEGMILSEKELGTTEDNNKVAVIPGTSPSTGRKVSLGDDVVEIYRHRVGDPKRPYALPYENSVMAVFRQRREECSKVLQAIESGAGEMYELWRETKEWSMEEFQRIYRWIDARFDDWFFESEYGESSKALVREFMVPNEKDAHQGRGSPAFVASEGAVGVDLAKWKLGFCLLIKSDGTALYATRDLALAQRKFEKYGIEKSLYVVDEAQTLHFQQVFKCLELMGYEQAKKCKHLAYAQVVLPDGKMSSRKGNVVLFSQLEADLTARIHEDFLNKFREDPEWTSEEIDRAGHLIALASMRYGMLNQDMGSQIVFDLKAWCSAKGNTGPYLMYAYARTRSILRSAKTLLAENSPDSSSFRLVEALVSVSADGKPLEGRSGLPDLGSLQYGLLEHELEHELIGLLNDYPQLMEQAAAAGTPAEVCRCAYNLSKAFSQWFQTRECSVVRAATAELQLVRILLVDATGRTLRHALGLIGIQTLEKM